MSASEKLRGWDRALAPGTVEPRSAAQEDVAFWELRHALPQIVAVVQAAEHEHPEPHNYWAKDADGYETDICPVCAALAALDEALQ